MNFVRVISSQAVVTALEWDLPGHKLLVADASGIVSLWTLKEHVLNDWLCLGTHNFVGEHIIGAAFFHNGKKVILLLYIVFVLKLCIIVENILTL